MDCAKLRADIEELKTAHSKFEEQFEQSNEIDTDITREELKTSQSAAEQLSDSLLQEYCQDIFEHNPQLRLSVERVSGWVEGERAKYNTARSITLDEDGNAYVCGDDMLFVTRITPDGQIDKNFRTLHEPAQTILCSGDVMYAAGARRGCIFRTELSNGYGFSLFTREFRDQFENPATANVIVPYGIFPTDTVIGGENGAVQFMGTYTTGEAMISDTRFDVKDYEGSPADVYAITEIPSNVVGGGMSYSFLVGGKNGTLCKISAMQGISYITDEHTSFVGRHNTRAAVFAITYLIENDKNDNSDYDGIRFAERRALIGGEDGALYEYDESDPEHPLKGPIQGFEAGSIRTITALSSDSALICGDNGAAYIATRSEDGEWKLENCSGSLKTEIGEDAHIFSAAKLPNGEIILGGNHSSLFRVHIMPPSVETIKQNLDKIISEGT